MRKQRVLELRLNQTFVEKKVSCDVNQLKVGKKKENTVYFKPQSVFHEIKKGFLGKLKSKRNLVLYVEGAVNALEFGEAKEDVEALWTQKEVKTLVKKEMSKSLTEHKPMKMYQFIILGVLGVACLIFLLRIAMQVGAL